MKNTNSPRLQKRSASANAAFHLLIFCANCPSHFCRLCPGILKTLLRRRANNLFGYLSIDTLTSQGLERFFYQPIFSGMEGQHSYFPTWLETEGNFSKKRYKTSNSLFTSIRRAWKVLWQDFFTTSFRSLCGKKESASSTVSASWRVVSIG